MASGRVRIRHFLLSIGVSAAEADEAVMVLRQDKTRIFLELVETGGVPLRLGAGRLVEQLLTAGVPQYIATTGNRE